MRPFQLKGHGFCADNKSMNRYGSPTAPDHAGLTARLDRRAAEGRPRTNPAARMAAATVAGIPLSERVSAPGKIAPDNVYPFPTGERETAETLNRLAVQIGRARANGDWQLAELAAVAWHRVNAKRNDRAPRDRHGRTAAQARAIADLRERTATQGEGS